MFKYLFAILIAIFSFQYIFPSNIIDTSPIREVDLKDKNGLMKHWKVYEGYAINDNNIQNQDLIQETWINDDEDILLKVIVPGSPPPDEYDQAPVQLSRNSNVAILDGVPATSWIFGCGPTSGQMIAGYYDRHGYDEIYTGPTNDGFFPLDNSIWGSTVINDELRELGPLSASMMGLDGRTEKGHVDDYWYQYESEIDPYYGNWLEHDWYAERACLADFMGTSQQNNYGLSDGSTFIWVWTSGHQMIKEEFGDIAYGVNKFFENQGYNVDSYYNQITMGGSWWEEGALGFTFENYKNEIDNDRPVMIHVEGHIMVGVGYDESTSPETIYIHNTWDYNLHSMDWNGSYSDMPMWAVSCFQLSAIDFASADFSASSTSGDAPLSVEFTDNSISWDGEIINWSWNLGDGNTSTDQNPTHIFNEPGEYTITLIVTDNNGNIVTETKENYINVFQPPDMCVPNNFDINNINNSIFLSWDAGLGGYEELSYFTGWWQNAYYFYSTLSEGAGHGVRFTPTGTYDIDSVHVAVRWDGWPNDEHEGPVAVQIYNENNDMPNDLIWSGETSTFIQDLSDSFGTPGSYGWALIYPELSNLSGDYFVFVGQGEEYEVEGFLYSWNLNHLDNIYVVENGTFSQGLGSYLNGDPMTASFIRNYGSEESCYYNDFLSHNIYRNGELINTTTLEEYTDILLEEGEHCYQVSNVYESGESELTAQVCVEHQIFGCMEQDATNYNPDATADDGSCIFDDGNNNVHQVPLEFTTIQAGIDASSDGDTVLVAPGTYYTGSSFIDFSGKNIVLKSTNGPEETIIDAIGDSDDHAVIVLCCGATLDGFTVINGSGYYGAIHVNNDEPATLRNLVVRDNTAAYGAGISCYYAGPLIENVTILNNSSGQGAGVYCLYHAKPTIINSIIQDEIWVYPGNPDIDYTDSASVDISYSNIIGNWEGEGNIDSDPLFTDSENDEYTLQINSPCIDAGDPDYPRDPDGSRVDMGALPSVYGTPFMTTLLVPQDYSSIQEAINSSSTSMAKI